MFLNHSSKPSYNEEKHIFACCEKECLQLTSVEIVFCATSALARIHKTVDSYRSFSCKSYFSFLSHSHVPVQFPLPSISWKAKFPFKITTFI